MSLFKKSIFLLILSIAPVINVSQAFADYRSDAAAINSAANPQASLTEAKAQNIIPNYSSNPPQTNYYNNPAAMDDQSHLAVGNDAAGMVATSAFNNKGDYDLSDLPRDNSPAITNNDISDIIRLFTVPYSDCHPSATNSELHTINTCDQYYQVTQNSCQINRDINVFSSFTYSCSKNLVYSNRTCNKTLTISCGSDDGDCDSGGINLVSKAITSPDGGPRARSIDWSYSYPFITINTYWVGADIGHMMGYVSANVNFNIINISDIKIFNLRSINYNRSSFSVKLNDIPVSGNQDLIPYLRNGSNVIQISHTAMDVASSSLRIEARQKCCVNPQEVWTEVCL